MRILALDLSTTCTGYCVDTQMGPMWGSIQPKHQERRDRVYLIVNQLEQLAQMHRPQLIVAEDIGLFKGEGKKQNLLSILALAELRGAVDFEMRRTMGFGLEFLHLSTLRSRFARQYMPGMQGLPKKDMIRACLKEAGYNTKNDDESDAIAVYLARREILKDVV